MSLKVYFSGEIHTDWREQIIEGAKGLDVTFSAPVSCGFVPTERSRCTSQSRALIKRLPTTFGALRKLSYAPEIGKSCGQCSPRVRLDQPLLCNSRRLPQVSWFDRPWRAGAKGSSIERNWINLG